MIADGGWCRQLLTADPGPHPQQEIIVLVSVVYQQILDANSTPALSSQLTPQPCLAASCPPVPRSYTYSAFWQLCASIIIFDNLLDMCRV